jgi:hypothetical protein
MVPTISIEKDEDEKLVDKTRNGDTAGISTFSSLNDDKDSSILSPQQQIQMHKSILWRDLIFVICGGIALKIVSYVETNAAYHTREVPLFVAIFQSFYGTSMPQMDGHNIIDAGFVLTLRLHQYLADHRDINDILAFCNSLVLIIPILYVARVTLWEGDYTLSFRLLATQLFRSLCGWFTYLPPDPTFIMSIYDFPEIAQCAFQYCGSSTELQPLPFVSFFSGHVASTVIIANHMYMKPALRQYAVALHAFNVFQILRLLATRGHYSIDIIIGWVVAVYVSNPAERLGRYYSRGVNLRTFVPGDAREAFEAVIGLHDIKRGAEGLTTEDREWLCRNGYQSDSFETMEGDDYIYLEGSMTAARVMAEIASKWARKKQSELQLELERHGMAAAILREFGRKDLLRLLGWAHLKMDELVAEAKRMDVKFREPNLPRIDILIMMLRRTRDVTEERARNASQWAQKSLADLRVELEKHGMRAQEVGELRRQNLIRLLGWAQLNFQGLKEEALKMGLIVGEGASRRDVIASMWKQFTSIMDERGALLSIYYRTAGLKDQDSPGVDAPVDEKL